MPLEWWAIFAVGLVGGALPLRLRWSDRVLHAALALSTGIFLGAVFLHLLPKLAAVAQSSDHSAVVSDHEHEHDAQDGHEGHEHAEDSAEQSAQNAAEPVHLHAHGSMTVWLFALIGVLAVHMVEALAFKSHSHDDLLHHKAVSYATLVGLTLHAFTEGVAFSAAAASSTEVAGTMWIAVLAHKGFETFSLTSVFQLAGFSRAKILMWITLFSLVTPLGALAGERLVAPIGQNGMAVATALATGTFLYVSLGELLPEVFHRHTDRLLKLALLLAGAGAMMLVHLGGY